MTAEDLTYELLHIPYSEESAIAMIKAHAIDQILKDRERIKDQLGDGIAMGFTKSIIDRTKIIVT